MKKTKGTFKRYLRYGIWLLLLEAINANRRHFDFNTSWLPHLLSDSVVVLLPELYQLADSRLDLENRLSPDRHPSLAAVRQTAEQLIRDNPDYVDYVAPLALGYSASHPKFNIYQGKLGALSLFGFGLDSIPHSTTAYAFSNMAYDAIEALDKNTPNDASLRAAVQWASKHKHFSSGAFLALLTLIYETSEYFIYQSEIKACDYDTSRTHMVWSVKDTVFDILSNTAGWAVAAWLRRRVDQASSRCCENAHKSASISSQVPHNGLLSCNHETQDGSAIFAEPDNKLQELLK